MDLTTLGFDAWFEDQAAQILQKGQHIARVTAVDRGAFLVRPGDEEWHAELSGKLRFGAESVLDLPCTGDWVCVQEPVSGGPAIIQAVLPRKTILRRKNPGKVVDFQVLAANLDTAFIAQSVHFDFNLRRLDRYLVVASEGGIEPIILLTKTDLIPAEDLDGLIQQVRHAGISAPLFPLSNTTGSGLDAVRALLAPGKTYGLLGSSGVGKTTLINRLLGRETLDTKAVSATGEGVHTTARRQLIFLDNGAMLLDTPGMRELGLLGAGEALEDSFADIHALSLECRFADCTHTREPGCAVLATVASGDLAEARYRSYLKLKRETAFHDLSYAEKRSRDKEFGRMVKAILKNGKR